MVWQNKKIPHILDAFDKETFDHKYKRYPDLLNDDFDVLHAAIPLIKIELVWTDIARSKITVNDTRFIRYSKTIYFSCLRLDKCGYLISWWIKYVSEHDYFLFKKMVRTKKIINVGKIIGKMIF